MSDGRTRLGLVVAGSLTDGIEARLDPGVSVEDMAVGRYVVVEGRQRRFFGMVTDVKLATSNPQFAISPPDVSDPFVAEVIDGTSTFGHLEVMPMLTIGRDEGAALAEPQPVKTVPSHFSPVTEADEEDVASVFGAEDEQHFYVGKPLDMETKVCLNLDRLIERSIGVFGKSGTGKTFLTLLLLSGVIKQNKAVNLVFDMHNDYGWQVKAESGYDIKGLRQVLGSRVAIFTLDEQSTRDRGVSADEVVEIGYDEIEPEDIALLRETLGMTEAQIESIYRLSRRFGERSWLAEFLAMPVEDREILAQETGLNPSTLTVLHRKMDTRVARLPFLRPESRTNSVRKILEYLKAGRSVVLEFGRHNSLDAYILVANILTRRIHEQYVEEKDRAQGKKSAEPPHLLITIEEAHKFLNPQVADQTIFGTIAREMRKYNVTLLVVDQRPSGIADEVMSQIGTRVTCLLDDDKDIAAVLSGVSGAQSLRGVLARLDSKQQALILGHAVPMPVVIRTRDYGTTEFYGEFQFAEAAGLHKQALADLDDLFPE
ncbi:MAG: ATP-binding protein [Dehalococcoidales bacterium]|nr:ATP-binding protein [Dehalococcoidales bacterium]